MTRAPSSSPRALDKGPAGRTLTATLLYWLLLFCGLVGLSIQRIDSPNLDWIDLPSALVPLWTGSIVGVAVGQFFAWARVRAWVPILVSIGSLWALPIVYVLLQDVGGKELETAALAFLPAAICGYLSLSERGALVAFWYPAVLWMMVILDAQGPGSAGAFDAHVALPFAVGLVTLFVAFLRARETRRAAIWASHANVRLAPARSRAVLQTTPLRTFSQHAFTGLVGGASLVLATWIAPHLWKTDKTKPQSSEVAWAGSEHASPGSGSDGRRCCPIAGSEEVQRERVREYFPLLRSRVEHEREARAAAEISSCTPCRRRHHRVGSWEDDGLYGQTYVGRYEGWVDDEGFSYASSVVGGYGNTDALASGAGYVAPPGEPAPIDIVPPPPAPVAPIVDTPLPDRLRISLPKKGKKAKAITPPTPAPKAVTPTPAPVPRLPTVTAPRSQPLAQVAPPVRPGWFSGAAPWQWALAFVLGGLFLPVSLRTLRRAFTLRHLARPFWAETVDQRISNHWQRMLIGLADAGIQPKSGEQPLAFAKRIGLQGMETCATILERVRHGVRVDASDVDAMGSAASATYEAARQKAGFGGRASAWLRWPLA